MIEAAVLLEAGWDNDVDETWAVLTPVEMAVQRCASLASSALAAQDVLRCKTSDR